MSTVIHRKFWVIVLAITNLGTAPLFAQQAPFWTQYAAQPILHNPGWVASRNNAGVSLAHHQRWLGWEDAPQSQLLAAYAPLPPDHMALGITLTNDRIGANSIQSLQAIYAYRVQINNHHYLGLGLQVGVLQWRTDLSQLQQQELNDPVYQQAERTSLFLPGFGLGVYYRNPSFYLGASLPRLLPTKLRDVSTENLIARYYRHYFLMAGTTFDVNSDWTIEPAILIKNAGALSRFVAAPTAFDINTDLGFKDWFKIGVVLRSAFQRADEDMPSGSLGVRFTLQLKNGLQIGTAYDYSLGRIRTVSVGSYEVIVGYSFRRERSAASSPRYF